MKNCTTKKPLRVLTGGRTSASLALPAAQLDEVKRLLDAHQIRYSINDIIISYNGGPGEALMHLYRGSDAGAVQELLDSVE